jgi:hypothetical protein
MAQINITHKGQELRFKDEDTAQAYIDQIQSPRGDLQISGGTTLFQLLNEVGAPMCNWREINVEICSEWNQTFTWNQAESNWPILSVKRVHLLALFKTVMDIAESTVAPEDVQIMRDTREGQYKSFILQECMVGENVCTETLYAVTEREIKAGRMDSTNSLRKIAADGISAPHLTRAELLTQIQPIQPLSFRQKISNFFSKN